MYISKPKTLEELYQFFIKGIPLKPINTPYLHVFKRKGWNVYANHITNLSGGGIRLDFYTVCSAYYPDWKLKAFEYVDTETN